MKPRVQTLQKRNNILLERLKKMKFSDAGMYKRDYELKKLRLKMIKAYTKRCKIKIVKLDNWHSLTDKKPIRSQHRDRLLIPENIFNGMQVELDSFRQVVKIKIMK